MTEKILVPIVLIIGLTLMFGFIIYGILAEVFEEIKHWYNNRVR